MANEQLKGLTDKEAKLLGYLINKVLNEKKSLNDEEHQELKDILAKLQAYEDKLEIEKKPTFYEQIDLVTNRALIKTVLKKHEELKFNELPLSEKAKKLVKDIQELKNSTAIKAIQGQAKEREDAEEFERFYAEHVKRNGKSL